MALQYPGVIPNGNWWFMQGSKWFQPRVQILATVTAGLTLLVAQWAWEKI